MANFNKVLLMGNMTRDPQLRYLPSQTPLVEFGLAINRRFTVNGEQREETCFVDCTAFGKPAEVINQYCQKGKAIFIEGRLKFDSWEDKQGGGKRSKLSVVVENFQFIGGPGQGGGGGGSYDEYDQRPQSRGPQRNPGGGRPPQRAPQQPPEEPPFSDEAQFKEDDIPF
jgi:single-strand DNA-binding protein